MWPTLIPQCKNDNARVTTVPLKALSDQVWIRYSLYCLFLFVFFVNVTCAFLTFKKRWTNYQNLTLFDLEKRRYIPIFKDTIVNRALSILHKLSFEITLTVPLMMPLYRAVAGQAGVPFFHATGSEFDEVLVGQGARRVRDLFKV